MEDVLVRAVAGARGPGIRSDCWVAVEPAPSGQATAHVTSKVDALYGASIREQVHSTLAMLQASDLTVTLDDSGALPFTLAARLETAVRRLRPATVAEVLPEINPPTRYPSAANRLRRSRLYLPGNTPKFFINAGLHKPDAVILDLEDSVHPDEKDVARILVRNALRAVCFYGAEKMVRINQLPLGLEDVRALVPHGVHTFLIPKVEDAEQVITVARLVGELRREQDIDDTIYLIPIIESARGMLQARDIASASPSIVALTLGLEDYTADIGAERTPEGLESLWARSQIVNAARAAGIQPLNSVYTDVADEAGLRTWVDQARAMGFEGVGCLHPRQVRVVHEAFSPQASEVERAQRIVAAFEQAQAAGLGVVAVDNKMIDRPVVERSYRVLRLAQAAAKPSEKR